MGLLGWLFRRWLAAVIFAPLLLIWYLILVGSRPAGPPSNAMLAAVAVAASFTDFLIIRAIKRRMKARARRSHQQT